MIKKAPSELTVMVSNFIDKVLKQYRVPKLKMTIDSAEGALRNQYFKDFGERWHPVAKKKNQTMIDMVISLLAEGRFYYLDIPANKIFYEEHKMYRYDEKTIHKMCIRDRYVTEVVAENFQMLESRAAREGSNANQGNTSGAFGNDNGYTGPYGQQAPQQQGPNFARESGSYGNANPLDISSDDLPF